MRYEEADGELQEESSFQVILSPMAQAIDQRFKDLIAQGVNESEAVKTMMNNVNQSEMPSFMEWLKSRDQ